MRRLVYQAPGAVQRLLQREPARPGIWNTDDVKLDCGPAVLHLVSHNPKLSPVRYEETGTRPRPVADPPFCASTYLPIRHTCPSSCPFKGSGCMSSEGWTRFQVRRLEQLADDWGMSPDDVIACESDLIARAAKLLPGEVRGRDLRLHISGDATTTGHAVQLGMAASQWCAGRGGAVWTYTHGWAAIARVAWGRFVSVLASVESGADAEFARARGYAPAIVVGEFPRGDRAFRLRGSSTKWIPCPAETRSTTCVECRLCLDRDLVGLGLGIAFRAHGAGRERAVRRLPVVEAAA